MNTLNQNSNPEFKKGDNIYIKVTIGLFHIKGYTGKVDRVTKQDGKITSIRVHCIDEFDIETGVKRIDIYKPFSIVHENLYQVYDNVDDFRTGMNNALNNIVKICNAGLVEFNSLLKV